MAWLEFISSLVRSVAWPVTVVIIALRFRSAIQSSLAGTLKRLKVGPGGAEFEWDQSVHDALEQLPPDAAEKAEEAFGGGLAGELRPVAEVAPNAAVMEAFIRIERELRRLAETSDLVDPARLARMGGRQIAEVAYSAGWIADSTMRAIEELSIMRNLAAHGRAGDLDTERALEFVRLADAVLYALASESVHGSSADSNAAKPDHEVKRRRRNRLPAEATERGSEKS